jgi:hypothetical protein
MDLTVCSQPLTFDETALTKKDAGRASNPRVDLLHLDLCRVNSGCTNPEPFSFLAFPFSASSKQSKNA